jgi:Holliday junction resolvasome RuvABC endonuclease subunit
MKLSLLSDKPKRICSIDASTNNLAFAIFDDEKLIAYDKIDFNGKDIYSKIGAAAKKTGEAFQEFHIGAIVIEHTIYINSPKTMAELSMVQGALLGSAILSGISKVGSINPITWQTFIGNGKLKLEDRKAIMEDHPDKSKAWYKNKEREIRKEKTVRFVNTYYDIDVQDHDIADAIGVGHYAINNWLKIFS